jgi:hypothetical protein
MSSPADSRFRATNLFLMPEIYFIYGQKRQITPNEKENVIIHPDDNINSIIQPDDDSSYVMLPNDNI